MPSGALNVHHAPTDVLFATNRGAVLMPATVVPLAT